MTRTAIPVSRRSRRTSAGPFRASRTALVATARKRSTRRARASRPKSCTARTARSIASAESRPVVKARRPRRTISFTRSTTLTCPSGLTSAITMWTELDPTSMAARRTAAS